MSFVSTEFSCTASSASRAVVPFGSHGAVAASGARVTSAGSGGARDVGADTQPFVEEWFADTCTVAIGAKAFEQHWQKGGSTPTHDSVQDARMGGLTHRMT